MSSDALDNLLPLRYLLMQTFYLFSFLVLIFSSFPIFNLSDHKITLRCSGHNSFKFRQLPDRTTQIVVGVIFGDLDYLIITLLEH